MTTTAASTASFNNTEVGHRRFEGTPIYNRIVPIHALKKVALIEREFREPVHVLISDYAPAPQIEYPDPFLLAVIPNPALEGGTGRFIIDFWDEPGFGLERMLK